MPICLELRAAGNISARRIEAVDIKVGNSYWPYSSLIIIIFNPILQMSVFEHLFWEDSRYFKCFPVKEPLIGQPFAERY